MRVVHYSSTYFCWSHLGSLQDAAKGDEDDSLRSRVHELLQVLGQSSRLSALYKAAENEKLIWEIF